MNTNSKEYVKIVYGLKSLEEANKIILERNKSPFYRCNFNTDDEYKQSQTRTEEFYGIDKFEEVKKRIRFSNSLPGYIKKNMVKQKVF